MKIIEYTNTASAIIEFQDEHKYTTNTTYQNFKIGKIANPYDKTVFGIGCLGVGGYMAKVNNKLTDEYNSWKNLLARCYSDKYRYLHKTYEDCYMCDDWLNFQNHAAWYYENWYDVGEGRMHIDKDILIKGNKLYSPETCLIVPQRVNMMFMTKGRKDDLPTGITKNTSGTYVSCYNGKRYGTFKTLEEAVKEHDKQKRIHIKKVVEEYGNKLPPQIQEILLKW
jgi:hypothetical protein